MSNDDPTKNLDDHALLLQLIAMFRAFDERLQGFDERLRALEARSQEHDSKMGSLEKMVEARLYDTRPIWEAVQLQITELRAEMAKGFRRADRKMELFHEQVVELYAYQRDMEERLEKLEPKT
jgi:hypothetical protein